MSETLQDMRNFLRLHMDMDATDLPDVLADAFLRQGSIKVQRADPEWPFYESEVTLASQVGVQSYTLPTPLEKIIHVRGPLWDLQWIDQSQAEHAWPTVASMGQSSPLRYSTFAGKVKLWPIPSAVETFTFRGFKAPTDWIAAGAGASPDFPDDFIPAVKTYALSRAYVQQTDPQTAAALVKDFEELLVQLKTTYKIPAPTSAVVLNQGLGSAQVGLIYPWGQRAE